MQPGNAIIDVAEGPRLFAVTPNFNLVEAFELCGGDFSTQGSGCLLSSTLPSSERTEDVVESHNPSLEPVILPIVSTELFADEFLPPICILRRRGIGVFFL